MSNAVIPAPGRFDHNAGEFAFRSGTTIAYINIDHLRSFARARRPQRRRVPLASAAQRSIAEEFGVSHTLIHQIWDALRLRGLFTRNIGSVSV
jgi:peroxiredoxin